MSKKRSCRRTPEESDIHEQAVRIRKMTDAQIVDYISAAKEEAWQGGYAEAAGNSVQGFIDYLRENKIQGIGAVTVNKLARTAADNGFT